MVEFSYMKKSSIVYLILLILFGAFLFIAGELDDSPGLQLIGVFVVIAGIVGLVKDNKKILNRFKRNKNTD